MKHNNNEPNDYTSVTGNKERDTSAEDVKMKNRTHQKGDANSTEKCVQQNKKKALVPSGDEELGLQNQGAKVVPHVWKVPDGGYGWVIVGCALVISLIVDGLTYTFGVCLDDFERAFQQPKSTISLASSLQVGLYLFIGPVVSALTNRFGCRPVIIAGSLVAGLAFIISAWSVDVTMLILTYGVIGGIGFGLMYLPAIVAVSVYFEERRALATGIAVCGSGIGTFILAPLTDYLLIEFNWSWTLMLLGALILNGMVFGALVRPLQLQRQEVELPEQGKRETPRDYDTVVIQDRQKAVSPASNGGVSPEVVPLLESDTKNKETGAVVRVKDKAGEDSSTTVLFASTPNMANNSVNAAKMPAKKDGSQKSHEALSTEATHHTSRPRSNTLDFLFRKSHEKSNSSVNKMEDEACRARAHAPLGLAFISLSDADLNKIREDVHLPLSRKDIHLSGPLPFAEVERKASVDGQTHGLYVQSAKSLSSLTATEQQEELQKKPTGLWSYLPVSARDTLEEMLSMAILKDKRYWCVLMGNFFCMIGFYVPFVYVPALAKNMGIGEDGAAFLLSIIGITNTVGRVMTGVLINFFNIDCILVTTVALGMAGVMTIACPLCYSYPALAVVSAMFGICVAAYISLCSVLLCELLGVENLTNAFGFVILFRGVACIMGPPIAGAIIDQTKIFDPSFYIGGGFIVLGALSHLLLLIPVCRRQKSRQL